MFHSYGNLYVQNMAILKRFGTRYKLVILSSYRQSGFEGRGDAKREPLPLSVDAPEDEVLEKLDNSISRTRGKVYELAACNPWQYFVTLTLDKEKFDRYDLPAYRKAFAQWVRNFNRLNGCSMRYLLIPERHKDGAWHMHGLLDGIPEGELIRNKFGYLYFPKYSKRFGFISLDVVRSKEGVSRYITKYISKDLADRRDELHAHLYYASQGLLTAPVVNRGQVRMPDDFAPDFQNEYCSIYWADADVFSDFFV